MRYGTNDKSTQTEKVKTKRHHPIKEKQYGPNDKIPQTETVKSTRHYNADDKKFIMKMRIHVQENGNA